MIQLEFDEYFIFIRGITSKQAEKLNAVWLQSKQAYRLPKTLYAMRELWQLGIRGNLKEEGVKRKQQLQKLMQLKKSIPESLADNRLRPYQQADVNYLYQIPHVAIFNEQRTGKTPTALKLIEKHGFKKGVIVCPASLIFNWEKEMKHWTDLTPAIVKGAKAQRKKVYAHFATTNDLVLIISYDTLKLDVEFLTTSMEFMVLDEAHYINNHRSQRATACYRLAPFAKKRIALTGTPARNNGAEVFGILRFLYPDMFPGYWAFVERLFHTWDAPWGAKEIGKPKRPQELEEILNVISVQRKRKDVMKWIPEKTYETIVLDMSTKQRKAYESMLNDFIVQSETGELLVDAPSVLSQLTRLRQLTLAPSLLDVDAPSVKEDWLREFLENETAQAIIFSTFSSYLKRLAEQLKLPLIIGETPLPERQKIVEEFQQGKHQFLLANIKAAGVGLTLDRAEVVIFLDRDYNPVNNEQAEDRIVPTTRQSNQKVHIIDLVCRDTVDERIHKLLQRKKNIIALVNEYKDLGKFLGKKT